MLSWGNIIRLCLANMAIGGLAALPVNLFNRLMTVELALPAVLPGLLVALHYAVQISRPAWGHRSDRFANRSFYIIGGTATVGLGLLITAAGIAYIPPSPSAILLWIICYGLIGLGISAAGTSFLALLAASTDDARRGLSAMIAWLMLIAGAIAASIGSAIFLAPYSETRLMAVVAGVAIAAILLSVIATWSIERRTASSPQPPDPKLRDALRRTWADPAARAFTGFVFLSILAFYLSELILEPFAGHIHGLNPSQSTMLGGWKDSAALAGMISAGVLTTLKLGSLRLWAIIGCAVSAIGLTGLSLIGPLTLCTLTLGFGNGLFVVGAIGSMMRLASQQKHSTGIRMGVFGAAQAIAAGTAGIIATAMVDLIGLILPQKAAYGTVFALEAALFALAALMALRLIHETPSPQSTGDQAYV